jgi:hypothetical protein
MTVLQFPKQEKKTGIITAFIEGERGITMFVVFIYLIGLLTLINLIMSISAKL